MILPKQEDGFFPEREDLPLLEVTAKMGLWYRLIEKAITSENYNLMIMTVDMLKALGYSRKNQ